MWLLLTACLHCRLTLHTDRDRLHIAEAQSRLGMLGAMQSCYKIEQTNTSSGLICTETL